ncbi:hypothetical protein AGABI2DRAFT_119208 [Agaricus bisporus var. bisporus H97]|uniref:hypothetical protein n=1 Tax=Agaricus bisporus var. bisporus (strain H97 / ATCC MYA-4626 / FGSC 10389) TaxID=936046 RepID=UPI00029F501E|nr:hypothetical protein AGABI2DRAFT_119208 [Agaricus bisporus var. bisporus H97]EKV45522.1 hypothetical protein AGABI2DRAFT_119208 [Agaricus bisporus var. bisporus H97]
MTSLHSESSERGRGYFYLFVEKSLDTSDICQPAHPHGHFDVQAQSSPSPRWCPKDEKVHFLIPHVASPQHVAPPQQVISPPGGRGSPEHQSPPCTALPSRASVTPGRSQTPEKPSPLSTYISQNSLEGTLSNMSTITESEEERPTRAESLFTRQEAGPQISSIKSETPGESPYHCPQQTSPYRGKLAQTWYYDQRSHPIPEPPRVPPDVSVPFKALYICDVMSNGQPTKHQTWINESNKGVHWVAVGETEEAKQYIDGEAYIFYEGSRVPLE